VLFDIIHSCTKLYYIYIYMDKSKVRKVAGQAGKLIHTYKEEYLIR
jgi:hypothetical protein